MLDERPPPAPPGPGQIQIAVAYTGICGTDLHIFHGDMDARVQPPTVIGHEMSGRIAALGAGTTGWEIGAPVTVMPTRSCGGCAACRRGLAHICHRLDFIGIDSPGAMQSLWTVPADLVIALPRGLPLEFATLAEPAAVAVHDVRRARVTGDDFVVVVGGGPVGLLIAAVATREGARVLVVEPDPFRRSVSMQIGIEAIDPRHHDVSAFVADRTDGAGADVAFEVSGATDGVTTAVDVLTTRGRLIMVAIHPKPREVNLHRFFWRELELLGARLYERSDFEEAVGLVAEGAIPAKQLISRVQPFEDVAAAFEALESRGGVMKVLVDCRDGVR
ncbi:zinc-dependent alcohol dehydrogenase [Jiangella alba]|uniref:zinc-dependent alcohol dehydrogenase n=1 Tax=Jiangella alba TaxID=561176 RepID=UPI001C0B510A|nr:alcohol dehydrogenase catalytic domain-containing protein [Jiangella alba]